VVSIVSGAEVANEAFGDAVGHVDHLQALLAARRLRVGEAEERPGTDVMLFKIFSPKKLAQILVFLAQPTASFSKNVIKTLVFEKNANLFRRK
jgi:hypothetical protein